MKALKVIFLLVILVSFTAAGVLLQTSLVLRDTAFSEKYFERSFTRDGQGSMTGIIDDLLKNLNRLVPAEDRSSEFDELVSSTRAALRENDRWLDLQAPRIIGGLYGYFLAGSERGPVIDIKPIKDACLNALVEQAVTGVGNTSQVDRMIRDARSALQQYPGNETVKNTVVTQVMQYGQLGSLRMTRATAVEVVDRIAGSPDVDAKALIRFAAEATIRERIGYAEIRDELDLDLLFTTIYGEAYNPVSGVSDVIHTVKRGVLSTISVLFIALFLIIAIVAYRPKSVLRWVGAGVALSGVICIVLYGLAGFADANIVSVFKELGARSRGADMASVQNWVLTYVGGVRAKVLVYAVTATALGAVLVTASYLATGLLRRLRAGEPVLGLVRKYRERQGSLVTVRTVLVILLLAAVPLAAWANVNSIRAAMTQYEAMSAKAVENAVSTEKALGTVLNAQKLIGAIRELPSR